MQDDKPPSEKDLLHFTGTLSIDILGILQCSAKFWRKFQCLCEHVKGSAVMMTAEHLCMIIIEY
jgi:hypothetical protein